MLSIEKLGERYNSTQLLVILLTRLYFKKITAIEVQAFITERPIDWALFYQTAAAHHIRAFIYHVISTHRLVIDGQVDAKLKQHALIANVNSLHQAKFQQMLLAEFDALGVTAIPYKGVSFAANYYASISCRESSDLDFLVPEQAVEKLRAYFHAKHYQPKQDVAPGYLKYIIATAKELSFKTPVDALGINCSVEIQWKLIENFLGKFPAWDFFIPHLKKGSKKEAQGLTPTYDFICMASHHFVREPLTRFKYLLDAACLVETKGHELDMNLIAGLFKQFGYDSFFNSAMQVLQDVLGVSVPGFEGKGEHAPVVLQHILAYPVIDKIDFSNTQNLSLLFKFQPGNWARFKLAARIGWYSLLPGFGDVQEFKLPAYFLPVLFILRPCRLLAGAFTKSKKARLLL